MKFYAQDFEMLFYRLHKTDRDTDATTMNL